MIDIQNCLRNRVLNLFDGRSAVPELKELSPLGFLPKHTRFTRPAATDTQPWWDGIEEAVVCNCSKSALGRRYIGISVTRLASGGGDLPWFCWMRADTVVKPDGLE